MEDFADIEAVALRDVYFSRTKRLGASDDFHIRRILREYSQKFHTPLHVVYDLPLDFVVRAWLEEFYEDCTEEVMLKEINVAIKPLAQLMEERRREDEMDADTWLAQEDIRRSESAVKKIEDAVRSLTQGLSMLRTPEEQKTGHRHSAPAEMSNVQVKPGEKIKMTFGNVDLEGDSFGLLDDPKP